jgi:hypothetical protein
MAHYGDQLVCAEATVGIGDAGRTAAGAQVDNNALSRVW